MNTDKQTAILAAKAFKSIGGELVVVSPGSRNAPLIQSFSNEDLELISIVDERSAGFIALGIAIATRRSVGLCCTSGSALLNYAPALAEAYYLGVPLVVFSADRPEHLIDQGVGQTIRQQNVYQNFQKAFLHLPHSDSSDEVEKLLQKIVQTLSFGLEGDKGPVHINFPFDEPLYNKSESETIGLKNIATVKGNLPVNTPKELINEINSEKRVLILTGVLPREDKLVELAKQLSQRANVVFLKEHTSNLKVENAVATIDRVLELANDNHKPEVVVTLGEQIISKRIKSFISNSNCVHWHVSEGGIERNTFGKIRGAVNGSATDFLESLLKQITLKSSSKFSEYWSEIDTIAQKRHAEFIPDIPYSDFMVFKKIQESLPFNYHIQSANSSVVRYFQLFKELNSKYFHANRGTSGIDGSTSTAVGYCYAANEPTLLVTGDLSFMYDSNGLWNNIKSPLLRIIVINNSGGGIFRIIPGPQTVKGFEEYFEAQHQTSFEGICKTMGVDYECADSEKELDSALDSFFEISTVTKVLEVKTPTTENDKVLKSYFKYIKTGKREEVD